MMVEESFTNKKISVKYDKEQHYKLEYGIMR